MLSAELPARRYTCERCGAELANRQAWLDSGLCAECIKKRALEERAARHAAALATVPAAFRGLRLLSETLLERLPDRAVHQQVAARLRRAKVMTVYGPSGTCKTSLAAAAFNTLFAFARRGDLDALKLAQNALFVEAWAVGEARRRHKLGDGEAPLIQSAMTASFLVIDDLGKAGRNEASRKAEADILQARFSQGLPIMVTTEFTSREQLEAAYTTDTSNGEYIARRLLGKKGDDELLLVPLGLGRSR
ncbi:MAG: hypothetical protein ACTHU0_21665 [Kofleriaceae bacterium]